MANRLLLCLVLLCAITNYSQCKRFMSIGRRSGSSWGRIWGSSSASKPASSYNFGHTSSSGFGSSAPKYPSFSSGLSGFGSSAPKYPSSLSGLSGFGSSAPKYPSPSSGLSGFGSSAPNHPSASSDLSGFGSGATYYRSSSSGLSGFGSIVHSYPSSSSGLSGGGAETYLSAINALSELNRKSPYGTGRYPGSSGLSGTGPASKYPSSTGLSGSNFGSGSSTNSAGKYPAFTGLSGSGLEFNYPASTGLSGSGSASKYPGSTGFQSPSHNNYPHSVNFKPASPNNPRNVYNTNTGYGSTNNHGTHNYGYGSGTHSYGHFNIPTYYTAPQHVYITEYRNSGSRYGDLLTGLALYNMGRSHSHHHNYYYNDDYYRRRYNTLESSTYSRPETKATCTLRIKENDKIEVLKIPCEIVSTFTEGSKKLSSDTVTQTICVSNYTVINNTLPVATANSRVNSTSLPSNGSYTDKLIPTSSTPIAINVSANSTALPQNGTHLNPNSSLSNQTFNGNVNLNSSTVTQLNITVTNSTNCTVTTDPLTMKGPPVSAKNMECEVNIITNDSKVLRNKVDCETLLKYAKMPEPKKQTSGILPARSKLKSWLTKPPWWMSTFIAV